MGQQFGAQGPGIEFGLDTQTFELEGRITPISKDLCVPRASLPYLTMTQGSTAIAQPLLPPQTRDLLPFGSE